MLKNHSDECNFYIDESGDLGFGPGASDYFVIAAICIDNGQAVRLKRYIRNFRISLKLPKKTELKAFRTSQQERIRFCQGLAELPCSIHYIVVNKSKVKLELRKDTNVLYNYLTGLVLTPLMSTLIRACVHLDCRTIKVASGNSLHDYLRIKLWYEMNSPVNVQLTYPDSRECLGIQAADLVANAVFRKYEYGDLSSVNALAENMGVEKKLFF